MSATSQPSAPAVAVVGLTLEQLTELLEQAAARGAAQALAQQQDSYLTPTAAAEYIYGRADRLDAFHKLRKRFPEIDLASTGDGRFRRWKRSGLDQWLAAKPSALLDRRRKENKVLAA